MRLAVTAAAVLLGLAPALAASPEDAYFAARQKGTETVVKLEKADKTQKAQAADKAALADLTKRLNAIVGPVAVKGFAKTGAATMETLGDGVGANLVDGLAFPVVPAREDGSRLIATTLKLYEHWRGLANANAENLEKIPETLDAALQSERFYTLAVAEDSAFFLAAAIEIEKPAGADKAYAALGLWSQDLAPNDLNRLVVAVVKGQRLLIADVEAVHKAASDPACAKTWDAATAEAVKLNDAYQKGGAKDEGLFAQYTAAQQKAEREWLACVGKSAKAGAEFPALKQEAQDLAARMAGG